MLTAIKYDKYAQIFYDKHQQWVWTDQSSEESMVKRSESYQTMSP